MTRDVSILNERTNAWALQIQSIFNYQNITGGITSASAGARLLSFYVKLANPMQLDSVLGVSENIALHCRIKNCLAYRKNGQIVYQLELPESLWKSYLWGQDCHGLELGLTDTKEPVKFSFDPPHHLFCGTTRAGKSYAVRVALLGMISEYSPDDLGIVIVDPHGDFAMMENEIHMLRHVAGTTEQAVDSIYYVYSVMRYRVENSIKDDKRIVLIVDESQMLVDKSNEIKFWLKEIGNQAAKFRVHLILTSKKPTQGNLPDIINILGNRWFGKTNLDPATTARLIGQKGVLVSKLTTKGDFLHIDHGGIERFLVASIDDKVFDSLDRKEIKEEDVTILDSTGMPITEVGRPRICSDPDILPYYYLLGPNGITQSEAEKILGLKRTGHNLHQGFVEKFGIKYARLRKLYKRQSLEELRQEYESQYG